MSSNAIADLELTDLSGHSMLVNAFDIALAHSVELEVKKSDASILSRAIGNGTEKTQVTELVLKDVHVAVSMTGSGGGEFRWRTVEGYTVQVKESLSEVAAKRQGAFLNYLKATGNRGLAGPS